MTAVDFDPFASGPALQKAVPSTESQRELWTATRLGEDASCAFNESVTIALQGKIDPLAMEAALTDLVERHESLRSTFSADGLSLLISQPHPAAVTKADLGGLDAREQKTKLQAIQAQEVETPFDLDKGPLFRAVVVSMGESASAVVMSAHHAVFDGWSMAVVVKDLATLYGDRAEGRKAMLPPASTYTEYAELTRTREKSPEAAKDEQFWLGKFQGSLPVLELPTDRPRPATRTWRSRRIDHTLSADVVTEIKKSGGKLGASFFATMLAGFEALLHRLTGQDDLVVGIPAAGQNATGMKELVGHCVNTLPLRATLEPTMPFSQVVKSARTQVLDAFDHQQYTFGTLLSRLPLNRDPSRLPLVSVMFNVDRAVGESALAFGGLKATVRTNPRAYESFEIFINAAEADGQLVLETQFNADLFDEDMMARWLDAYEALMRAAAQSPETPIGKLNLLSQKAKEQFDAWNAATRRPWPQGKTVGELLFARAAEVPQSEALVFGATRLTYKELFARADALAHAIEANDVAEGAHVGICLERSPELLVAVLACLRAGVTYVPLDPAFPKDRRAFMAEDAKLALTICQKSLAAELPAGEKVVWVEDVVAGKTPVRPMPNDPERAAYVLYTSGSTGKPKGVRVPHRAVANFLASVQAEPGFTASDRLLAVTTLSFDIAVLELMLPLLAGGTVVMASREMITDGDALLKTLSTERISVMQATPATWRLLLAAGWAPGGQKVKVLVGGEALPRDLAQELTRRATETWNMYGPTETTVWSTTWKVMPPVPRVLIGKALANTTLHVLDAFNQPVPVGVPGELLIGGEGVALGYWNRPELTAEKFIADPSSPVGSLYRTGDLVRALPDGNLEYLRRNDSQVKVRGYRIELGEIETVLGSHPNVSQAVAIVREDHPGDVRLVGYLVAKGQAPDDASLRAHLRGRLPEYMVPTHLEVLPSIPLTPNGKVDRKALPAPKLNVAEGASFVEPRTETEKTLASIFAAVLGLPKVSVTANFFKSGGHSLLAAQAIARINRELGVQLSLKRLFESPTVEGLAATLGSGQKSEDVRPAMRIPKRANKGPAPLSVMQSRLWFFEQMEGQGSVVYNLPSAFRLKGALDVPALQRALDTVIARHETLRTTFIEKDGIAQQVVAETLSLPLTVTDWRGKSEESLIERLQKNADQPFDLKLGPLVMAELFQTGPEEHVFYFMPHHAIWDGWSFDTFLRELDVLYGAYRHGKPNPLPELPISYADFATWHQDFLQSPELERQVEYWKKHFAGELPSLQMPTDRPRPKQLNYTGATEAFLLSAAEVDALAKMGARFDCTLYMVILAGYQALLHRYTGQDDIIVGTPFRGRNQPETQDLIGFFVNALPLRTEVKSQLTFEQLLQRTRTTAVDAFAHADVPFERLMQELKVQRDLSRTPIFQTLFTFQDVRNRRANLGDDITYGQVHVHPHGVQTDLSFWVKETGKGIAGGLDYLTDLWDRETMVRFLRHLRTLLAAVAADPLQEIGRIPLLTETERQQLQGWNDTAVAPAPQKLVHQLVFAQAEKTPDAPAVVFGATQLSYAQLVARAKELASALRGLGVQPGVRVGLSLERSPDMVASLLGVLEAGGTYVPLDPAFPPERLAFMAEDAALPVVVTQKSLQDDVPAPNAKKLLVDAPLPSGPTSGATPDAEQPAYVLYTSGSTGKPKGVMVPHRAVVNFLHGVNVPLQLSAKDTLVAVTTLSFDIAVLELLLPLSVGGKVVLATREAAGDGVELKKLLDGHNATFMQATPATWRLLFGAGLSRTEPFTALVGGEAVPLDLAQKLAEVSSRAFNLYGPTETTVWSSYWPIPRELQKVVIGKPLPNQTLHILDTNLQSQPLGVAGELCIGGQGVTLGYLNRDELTKEKFIEVAGLGLVYRTGDRARLQANGDVDFLGRTDNQVKVRGYRIELGDIESALEKHPHVAQAVAMVREDRPGDVRLVAYVVPKKGEDVSEAELRKQLRKSVPEYMVPQHFVELQAMPLTPNGKVDRKALPAPQASARAETVPPRTAAEKLVAGIWQKVLNLPAVSVRDNFFDLGGHSLLSLQVVAEIERQTGQRPSPRVLLLSSIEQVAAGLNVKEAATPTQTTQTTQAQRLPPPPPQETGLLGKVLRRLKR